MNIHVHPEAAEALLQKDSSLWYLVFSGPDGTQWDMQVVTPHELSAALRPGYVDEDVVSYFEHQLAAAGYLVRRLPRGTDKGTWTLTFLG